MGSKKRSKEVRGAAAKACRHELYEQSVQEPEWDLEFVERVFREIRGRPAQSLREDFCGTALLCAEWVRGAEYRTAIGVDLDKETLDWAQVHRVEPLGARKGDLTLVHADVCDVRTDPVDVIAALNFSYSLIHRRADLLRYFARAREGLGPDGLFMLDFHAGPNSQEELVEETAFEDFTYVWEQGELDALSAHASRAIHFSFPDGSELRDAFTYDFRVWTIPELRDVLHDAGFGQVDAYYEPFDEDGDVTGDPRRITHITHEDSWTGYLVSAG
jgi:SAM-dependent methyltransferase